MNNIFEFTGAKKIIFGTGSLNRLPDIIGEKGAKRPFFVMDHNLSKSGYGEKLSRIMSGSGMKCEIFDKVVAEPELELADKAAKAAARAKSDIVVGFGGGSAMDLAKAVSALVANKGNAVDYLGLNRVPGPGLPTIMIPTTAGTGSEVTFTAVFVRKDLAKKEGMNSPFLYPGLALLDPELTLSLPPVPTAATGMDALCHAIESYTSLKANPMSEIFSLEAIRLISSNLRTCVHDGGNLEARSEVLLGSLYAGLGLANAGVGAAHSLSYPLGGKYGVSHGLANTIMLPRIMEFNIPGAVEKFAVIAEVMGEVVHDLADRDAACLAVEAVDTLIEDCGISTCLEDLGIPEEDFPELAKIAMTVLRPLENNPRKVTFEDAINIYNECM